MPLFLNRYLFFPGRPFRFLRQIPLARIALLCVGLCLTGYNIVVQAAIGDGKAIEQRVMAASLYKFLDYVEWPPAAFAQADSPYVIGVIDADNIADTLTGIAQGRHVNGRSVKVRKLHFGDSLSGLHALFIGRIDKARQSQILKEAQHQPILTVTDTEGALALGSMINFRLVDERVRFEVSLDAARKSELKISSRMLSVALLVSKGSLQ